MLAAVLGGGLVVVAIVAGLRLRAAARDAAELEAERARLAGELRERELEVAELKPYRWVVDAAPDWIWVTDGEGRITLSNPAGAQLLGHEDLTGRALKDLTHEGAPEDWAGVIRRVHADGSLRTVDTRSVPAGDGRQGIDRDLTSAREDAGRTVAIVRLPIVDGVRDVVGYELVGDGSVLEAFPPSELT